MELETMGRPVFTDVTYQKRPGLSQYISLVARKVSGQIQRACSLQ